MIYASGDSVSEVQLKLQGCLLNISKWYRENRLKINSDKSKVMLVWSKAQFKSINDDDFILKYEGTLWELVENAKHLGMSINSDISLDFHVQRLCQNLYYHLSLLRRLRRIFPKDLLLQVYKSYIQPRLDYGITCMLETHRRILTWSKGFRIMLQGWSLGILTTYIVVELTLSSP